MSCNNNVSILALHDVSGSKGDVCSQWTESLLILNDMRAQRNSTGLLNNIAIKSLARWTKKLMGDKGAADITNKQQATAAW